MLRLSPHRYRGQTLFEILIVAANIFILLTLLGVMLSRHIHAVMAMKR